MDWTPDRIKELRTSLKLSQQTFSIRVGVTREYVNKLERGLKTPSITLSILLQYIQAYGTEMKKESDNCGKK